MSREVIQSILGWSTLLNMGFLLYWWIMLIIAHNWVYRFHTRWFQLSRETFDAIHYAAMAFYKISIFLFNLVPYVALRFLV
jgi:hypothetical protein